MAGLQGAVGAYHRGEFCRFLEDGSIPSPCRAIFLETLEVHTCRKNPRKNQKLGSWEPAGFRSVMSVVLGTQNTRAYAHHNYDQHYPRVWTSP